MEKYKKGNFKGKINSSGQIALDTYKLEIISDLQGAKPGQFISVLCPEKTFRRPFSISNFDSKKHLLTILFKLKGDGTNYLKNLKKGDDIEFSAPLGNGFELLNKNSLLVGAGIGIAPMLFLKKELDSNNIKNYLMGGFKSKEEVIEGSDETVIGGSVLDNIEKIIDEKQIEIIYSCGPLIVLKLLSQIAKKKNIPSYLAMERVMACSLGVCRGCVIKLLKNNEEQNASVCKDGPVFLGSEIIWN